MIVSWNVRFGLCLVAAAVLAPGCAARQAAPNFEPSQRSAAERVADYPLGTYLDISLVDGQRVRGVLMAVEDDTVEISVGNDAPSRQIARSSIAAVSAHIPGGARTKQVLLIVAFLGLLAILINGPYG